MIFRILSLLCFFILKGFFFSATANGSMRSKDSEETLSAIPSSRESLRKSGFNWNKLWCCWHCANEKPEKLSKEMKVKPLAVAPRQKDSTCPLPERYISSPTSLGESYQGSQELVQSLELEKYKASFSSTNSVWAEPREMDVLAIDESPSFLPPQGIGLGPSQPAVGIEAIPTLEDEIENACLSSQITQVPSPVQKSYEVLYEVLLELQEKKRQEVGKTLSIRRKILMGIKLTPGEFEGNYNRTFKAPNKGASV